MKVNFDIKDNHALEIPGRLIDLHNDFNFVGFDYNVADSEIKLHWKKSNGDWVDKNEFSSLVLTHIGVTYLKVIEQDEKSTYQDDSCLGEITFFLLISKLNTLFDLFKELFVVSLLEVI